MEKVLLVLWLVLLFVSSCFLSKWVNIHVFGRVVVYFFLLFFLLQLCFMSASM